MKCSNPHCNRGIGLIAYRRGWFSKGRYAIVADPSKWSRQEQRASTYFEWLFLETPPQKLMPAVTPIKAR